MVDVSTIAVQAVTISALYALVAIGFTLIFGVGGVLNLAHGASITIGAFTAYYVASALGLGIVGALVAALVVAGLFSGVLYLGLIRPMQEHPIQVMILSLVTSVAIEQLILSTLGGQPRAVPPLVPGTVTIAGSRVEVNLLVVFVLSWLVIGGLFAFVNYTRAGKAVLATSMSRKGAALVGIEADRVNLTVWVVAGALAGLAGVFLASYTSASWAMGRTPLVLSFSIVVVGGLGSIRGSVLGAYLIGFFEVAAAAYEPRLQGVSALVILVLVLLVRPEGLFGRELVEG